MGSFLDKPKTDKTNEQGHGNELRYGLGAMQGWRIEMEDSHSAVVGLPHPGLENWSFFAVFDGHAGGTVSKFSSRELIYSILKADADLFDELATLYKNHAATLAATANDTTSSPNSTSFPNSNNSPNTSPAKRYTLFLLFLFHYTPVIKCENSHSCDSRLTSLMNGHIYESNCMIHIQGGP